MDTFNFLNDMIMAADAQRRDYDVAVDEAERVYNAAHRALDAARAVRELHLGHTIHLRKLRNQMCGPSYVGGTDGWPKIAIGNDLTDPIWPEPKLKGKALKTIVQSATMTPSEQAKWNKATDRKVEAYRKKHTVK